MPSSYEYTLLIVESESIASIIRQFNIPYLEVIATNGFCWRPLYNWKKHKLELRANPEQRSVRTLLKEKAPWASRIVIATDSDSAGEFIAYSLFKYLKIPEIQRTYLKSITPSSIQDAIDSASPYEEEPFHEMQNRFILHHFTDRVFAPYLGKMAWVKLAAIDLFSGQKTVTHFRDIKYPDLCFNTEKPVLLHFRDRVQVSKTGHSKKNHHLKAPINTADILERAQDQFSSFEEAQQSLNHLFTFVLREYQQALITYPRTSERTYYETTWLHEYEQCIQTQPAEAFTPSAVWSKTPVKSPHEGIHPIDSRLTPEKVRPLLRKKEYDLYKFIFEHHQKAISRPVEKNEYQYKAINTEINTFFLPESEGNYNDTAYLLSPRLTISLFLDHLVDSGSLKPSGFGKAIDSLLEENWIMIENNQLNPGFGLMTFHQKLKNSRVVNELIALLNNNIPVPDINKSKLFEDLTRISHIIFNS